MSDKSWKNNNTLIREGISSPEDIPAYLYHGTFGAYLKNILKEGLIPNKHNNWDLDDGYAKSGFVYLGYDPEFCGSMVECSENEDIPEEYFDDIKILEIDTTYIDPYKLFPDENFDHGEPDENGEFVSFQYKGFIPPEAISNIIDY